MEDIVYFNNFGESFETINNNGLIEETLKTQLFELIPNLYNYEEEGEKLNFKILFLKDIAKLRALPNYIFQKISDSELGDLNLKKTIKSIAPFSSNGWDIYISIMDNTYEFGIYKDLGSFVSLGLNTVLENSSFIEIEKIDKHKLMFTNKESKSILHISVIEENISLNKKENISALVNLFTKKIDDHNDYKEKFIKNISSSLFYALEKAHGTIITIQDSEIPLHTFINKGIIFDKPINLFNEYLSYIDTCSSEDNNTERFYSLTGMLSVALNIDGITLINNNAELLGYNIFIDNESVDTTGVAGGARKRAAYSIENSGVPGLTGIYFQSHDGDNYFKELN